MNLFSNSFLSYEYAFILWSLIRRPSSVNKEWRGNRKDQFSLFILYLKRLFYPLSEFRPVFKCDEGIEEKYKSA